MKTKFISEKIQQLLVKADNIILKFETWIKSFKFVVLLIASFNKFIKWFDDKCEKHLSKFRLSLVLLHKKVFISKRLSKLFQKIEYDFYDNHSRLKNTLEQKAVFYNAENRNTKIEKYKHNIGIALRAKARLKKKGIIDHKFGIKTLEKRVINNHRNEPSRLIYT